MDKKKHVENLLDSWPLWVYSAVQSSAGSQFCDVLGAGYLWQCCLTSSSSTLSKFVDAAKLCEVVDTLEEGRAAIQRDLQLERSNTMQRNWMGPGGQWAEPKSAMCPCWKEGQLPAAWTKTEPADKGCDFSHLCTVEGWAALDTGCSVGDSKLMWGEKGFFPKADQMLD